MIIVIKLYGGRIREEVGRSRLDGGSMTGPVRSEFTFWILNLASYILYFVFCILYFVFCICHSKAIMGQMVSSQFVRAPTHNRQEATASLITAVTWSLFHFHFLFHKKKVDDFDCSHISVQKSQSWPTKIGKKLSPPSSPQSLDPYTISLSLSFFMV